jgi:hypothetical protein
MKLGLDYQKDDTTTSVSYERIQSTWQAPKYLSLEKVTSEFP